MKGRGHKAVCFFFIHLGNIPCGDALVAAWAEYRAVFFREIYKAVYYAVIVHLYKVAFAYLLIVGNECFAVGASNHKRMAAADFFAVWVGYGFNGVILIGHPARSFFCSQLC